MKIIQLNIWHGKLGELVIDFLNEQRPDVVCLQEASDIPPGPTYGMFVPIDEIQRKTGLAHASFAPTFSYGFMRRTCRFGNAILSKYPLKQEKTVFIHGEYKNDFDRAQDEYNIRNLQVCEAKTPDGSITIVNHHGFHDKNPKGNERTIEALKKVAKIVGELKSPLIFCGDLNVTPDSPAMKPLNNLDLRNLTLENNLKTTLSQVHFLQQPVTCDYIFASSDIKIKSFQVSDEIVSDHNPLILEFDMPLRAKIKT